MVLIKLREEILSSPRLNSNRGRLGGVVVIGGANIDLRGRPDEVLVRHTSNPGRVNRTVGGVCRNIAHNLALLDMPVTFLSMVGDDEGGRRILEETGKAGVNIEQVIVSEKNSTGMYLAILDEKREMEVAVSDMELFKEINVKYIKGKRRYN